jgi:hypothetical protein
MKVGELSPYNKISGYIFSLTDPVASERTYLRRLSWMCCLRLHVFILLQFPLLKYVHSVGQLGVRPEWCGVQGGRWKEPFSKFKKGNSR